MRGIRVLPPSPFYRHVSALMGFGGLIRTVTYVNALRLFRKSRAH